MNCINAFCINLTQLQANVSEVADPLVTALMFLSLANVWYHVIWYLASAACKYAPATSRRTRTILACSSPRYSHTWQQMGTESSWDILKSKHCLLYSDCYSPDFVEPFQGKSKQPKSFTMTFSNKKNRKNNFAALIHLTAVQFKV